MSSDRFHLDWAMEQLADCRLCPRRCRANRLAGETGWCGATADVHWFLEYVGYGEEPELTPSHTLFLSHCSMNCLWCQTAADQEARPARRLTADSLRRIVQRGKTEGARNLNLLGGEPIVNLPGLLPILAEMDELPPLVWNSNSYCSAGSLAVLERLVSVYAMDLKTLSESCAERLTGTPDYPETAMARLGELHARSPERILLRHLVMPGHFACCTRPVLEWVAAALPGVRVSLQDYVVMPRARTDSELGRFLAPEELAEARDLADRLGLRLVERLPGQAAAPSAAMRRQLDRGRPAALSEAMDVELVLSPEGKVFLRHPSRAAAGLLADIVSRQTASEEMQ